MDGKKTREYRPVKIVFKTAEVVVDVMHGELGTPGEG